MRAFWYFGLVCLISSCSFSRHLDTSDNRQYLSVEHSMEDEWEFYRYPADSSFELSSLPVTGWEEVSLPHTAKLEPRIVNDQWQGDCLYRRSIFAPADWQGKAVWLRFEGAMSKADVYLNGELVEKHKGGYLPFTVELSDRVNIGQKNTLLVHLDNRDDPLIGPKPLELLDFSTYGGLYREVRLFVTDSLHITDEMTASQVAGGGIFVTFPEVSTERAQVSVKTHIANSSDRERVFVVVQELLREGRVVAESRSNELRLAGGEDIHQRSLLSVVRPALWSLDSPDLYDLRTSLVSAGRVVDQRRTRIGIRTIQITEQGLRINGKSMFVRGVNRHQEYPYVGYAISPNADYRDAKLIKEAGFDYVRLSHYPHSRHFMRAADELGLVVLDAILGWQFYNPDPVFSDHVVQTCRDLIRRDRNHPSVIAWECSLNESAMPRELVSRLHRAVHQEYPGDQVYSAGWLPEGYDIYLQARQHRLPHPEIPIPAKPYIVSEYGDWEYYAQNAGLDQDSWKDLKKEERSSRQQLSDGETRLMQQATNIQEAHNDNLSTPAFADGYWVMFDYNRGYADDLEASGIMSLERVAKPSYHFFRSQRSASEVSEAYVSGPMIHIANRWTRSSPSEIRIFSNASEVELFVNGVSKGRRRPDSNRISDRLAHPPFSFRIPFQAGELKAIGYDEDGAQIVSTIRLTPGTVASVRAELATHGVAPVDGDTIFVRGHLTDADGEPVPVTGQGVDFRIGSGLSFIGPRRVLSEGGVGSSLVRVIDADGDLSVEARLVGRSVR